MRPSLSIANRTTQVRQACTEQQSRVEDVEKLLAQSRRRADVRERSQVDGLAIVERSRARTTVHDARHDARDSIHATASDRLTAQTSTTDRLFFHDDIAPVSVPKFTSLHVDRDLLDTINANNNPDVAKLDAAQTRAAEHLLGRAQGQGAIEEWQALAEAATTAPPELAEHLDMVFITTITELAAGFSGTSPKDLDLLDKLEKSHASELVMVPTVASLLRDADTMLTEEIPREADEYVVLSFSLSPSPSLPLSLFLSLSLSQSLSFSLCLSLSLSLSLSVCLSVSTLPVVNDAHS